MSVELHPVATLPVVWDNGGSTAIPYGATERGTVYRECIRCGMACNSVSLRGMVCLMCRLGQLPAEPDDGEVVPLSPADGE
jgi:hypothetical protein